jgi:hypothetical protein
MFDKFDQKYNYFKNNWITEADEEEFPEDEEGDIPDEEGDIPDEEGMDMPPAEGDMDMPDDGMGMGGDDMGAELPPSIPPATKEEVALGILAIKALQFDPTSTTVNHNIYKDFEKHRNLLSILLYIERKIDGLNKKSSINFRFRKNQMDDEHQEEDNIVQKILIASRNKDEGEGLSDTKRLIWTRIIINAFKANSNDYDITEEDVTPETINDVYNRLKVDFNHDVRGRNYNTD